MRKTNVFLITVSALVALACSSDNEAIVSPADAPQPTHSVTFYPALSSTTRATETSFELYDQISVFAVQPSAGTALKPSGNYADNVLYTYQGDAFSATRGIDLPDDDEGLAYYAVYPYQLYVTNQGLFSVRTNQQTHSNLTLSDFCTAYTPATKNQEVWLNFSHRLSRICIDLSGNNLTSKTISMRLNDVCYETSFDLNTNSFTPTNKKSDILMGETSTNRYEAILVPQTFVSGTTVVVITIDGEEFPLYVENETTFRSGKEYDYSLTYTNNKIVVTKGEIVPWNTHESDCYVVPANEVVLYDRFSWEYSGTADVNTFQWMVLSAEDLSQMTDNEVLEELSGKNKLNYADDYVSYISKDSHNNTITEQSTYYIITVAYDAEGRIGPLKKTMVKTPAYLDEDNDAWVYFDNIDYNASTGFWFDATKAGKCSSYHMIYGNYSQTTNPALFAFEINYYLKYQKKHWFAENWGMTISLNNSSNRTFTFNTTDIDQYPVCIAYGWGRFSDGTLSSDLVGFQWDTSKQENNAPMRLTRKRKAEVPENGTICRSEEIEKAQRIRNH